MENKINIAELLKDCPNGMELDCMLFSNPVKLDEVADIDEYPCPITVITVDGDIETFTKYGQHFNCKDAKCVIFPKGKTTWEGFVPPCKFKDGDVLAAYDCLVLFKKLDGLNIKCYCTYHFMNNPSFYVDTLQNKDAFHPATEEEKQKLFQAIKDNGYRWNAETKTLEELVEPKFKVGDRIQSKDFIEERTIKICEEDGYWTTVDTWIRISDQDDWELVPNKFDINTLKPFESRVLVRDDNLDSWKPSFWGYLGEGEFMYNTVRGVYRQCIPYEYNRHLLGTTNDCDKFFKTWEK